MSVISGTNGNDNLTGTSGDDLLTGGEGNDTLSSGYSYLSGNDTFDGGPGNDMLIGYLGQGDLTLQGGDGDDFLLLSDVYSYPGRSILADGGSGDDSFQLTIGSSASQVSVRGGAGMDTYYIWFDSIPANFVITDFATGSGGDRLDVSALVDKDMYSNAQGPGGNPFGGERPLLRLVQQGNDTIVQFLVETGTSQNYHIAATLKDVDAATITADNFVDGISPDGAETGGLLLLGGSGSDMQKGGRYNDRMFGAAGYDTQEGGGGADFLDGGDDNDSLSGGNGNDTLLGGAGNDTLRGGGGLHQGVSSGSDSLVGGDGNDLLLEEFDGSDNIILGGDGNDTIRLEGDLIANAGAMIVDGGAGDDLLEIRSRGPNSTPVLASGGEGIDTYRLPERAFSITITDFKAGPGGDQIDVLALIESSVTNGARGGNPFSSAAGILKLVQDGGDCLLQYDEDGDRYGKGEANFVTVIRFQGVELASLTKGNFVGALAPDGSKVAGLILQANSFGQSLSGGVFDDTLLGGQGNDTLSGGGGDDLLSGGGGNDILVSYHGADTLQGEAGNDVLSTSWDGCVLEGGDGNDSLTVERYVVGASTLSGGSGNDTLSVYQDGAAGDAGLALGGDGNDLFNLAPDYTAELHLMVSGGNGADTYLFGRNYDGGVAIQDFSAGDQIDFRAYLERIISSNSIGGGNPFAAKVGLLRLMQDGSDVLLQVDSDGVAGNKYGFQTILTLKNVLLGSLADDAFAGDFHLDGSGMKGVAQSTATNFGQLTGSNYNDTLTGNGGNQYLSGGGGDDLLQAGPNATGLSLRGGAGDDTLIGGSGTDVLYGDAGDNVFVMSGGFDLVVAESGYDVLQGLQSFSSYTITRTSVTGLSVKDKAGNDATVYGIDLFKFADGSKSYEQLLSKLPSAWDDHLRGTTGNDTMSGGLGNDTLDGDAGNDSLIGGEGDDQFNPGTGRDTVDGGGGSDTVIIAGKLSDYMISRPNATDVVLTDLSGRVITVRNVENFDFDDGLFTRSQVLNNIASNGSDDLHGSDGNDVLDGGPGLDTLTGGLGDDLYVIENSNDVVIENVGEGTDSVNVAFTAAGTYKMVDNLENATITAAATVAANITGNTLDNKLIGNTAANTLIGGAGNDTLDGGAGADKLLGGVGDDVYIVADAGDVVTENANEGGDTVRTSLATYTMSANVEFLSYTGTVAFSGTGNAQDNVISGGNAGNKLDGAAGNDTLRGGDGNDSLQGGQGNDQLTGGGGKDTIDGGDGSDVLRDLGKFADYTFARPNAADTVLTDKNGNVATVRGIEKFIFDGVEKTLDDLQYNLASVGNDKLYGGDGADSLNGGPGADTLTGGLGNDIYVVDNVADVVVENSGEGNDLVEVALTAAGLYTLGANVEHATVTAAASIAAHLTGNGLDNALTGNAAANTLSGGAGNDTLDGAAGADKLVGGAGDDLYLVDNAGDTVTEALNEGTDAVRTTLASYTLGANVEHLSYTGSTAFTGTGNALDNTITGGDKGNKLDGGIGNDSLTGGAGADSLMGGVGNDTIVASGGKDTIDGGDGVDVLRGLDQFNEYTVSRPNATDTVLTDTAGNTITVRGVESFDFWGVGKTLDDLQYNIVSVGNDKLYGYSSDDRLDGGLGADTMTGYGGDDTYIIDNAGDTIVEELGSGTDTARVGLTSAGSTYTLAAYVENGSVTSSAAINLNGNENNNLLTGNAAANVLSGGAGDDTLDGGAGADKLLGGAGDDLYLVTDSGDVVIEGLNEGADTVRTALASYTLSANVEQLDYIGAGAFTAVGNTVGNHISGGNGGNKLDGGAGDDWLAGGSGADSLLGGLGNDSLYGNGGKDTVDGGDGIDYLDIAGYWFDYKVSRPNAADTVLADNAGNTITVRNVENFHFQGGGITTLDELQYNLVSVGNDKLYGRANVDPETMDGGLGADTMSGYGGDDTYIIDNAGDTIVEDVGAGSDTARVGLTTANATYALADNVENGIVTSTAAINLSGNAINNSLTGNAAANILNGGAGDDTLDGGAGTDKLIGGTGDDVYLVADSGDAVTEGLDEGDDIVRTSLASYTLSANVERLEHTGTTAFAGTGNALDNYITGGNGGAKLDGGAGHDWLTGGNGNDSLLGGLGNDTLLSGSGKDTVDGGEGFDELRIDGAWEQYTVSRPNAIDTVLTGPGGKVLTVRNVEKFSFYGADKTLDEVQSNIISVGNDKVYGGSDGDLLNGGVGADTMTGYSGNDTYVVDNVGDVIVEEAGDGDDTAQVELTTAGATYTLGENVENGIIKSASAVSLSGNAQNNLLTGNAAANTLSGGAGDDTLDGGAGTDKLIGGIGDDFYIVADSGDVVTEALDEGHDIVRTALASYTLSANVEELSYSGKTAFTGTGNAGNNIINGGNGGAKLDGGAGDDQLNGGSGNDSLLGGLGSDTLSAGGGKDTVDGGAGSDTAVLVGTLENYTITRPSAGDTVLTDAAGNTVTLRNVEFVEFSSLNASYSIESLQLNVASPGADLITGGAGDDTLNGGVGADTLEGGDGNDTYIISDKADVIVESEMAGEDLVQVAYTAAGTYTLADNVENATVTAAASVAVNLSGNDLANKLVGNAAANTLTGGAGDDTLDGGAGGDKLIGGFGDDLYLVSDAGDVVVEQLSEGIDVVSTTLSSYTLPANIEALFSHATGAFAGTGNALGNLMVAGNGGAKLDGGAGDDWLVGGNGNDNLLGGLGDDLFDASLGKDTVDGGAGNNTLEDLDLLEHYTVLRVNATDTLLTHLSGATVLVRNVQWFDFGGTAMTLAQALQNSVSPGTDTIQGTNGDDTLDGGPGNDLLIGGAGDDYYILSAPGDAVAEMADEGIDGVKLDFATAGTYTLAANVEYAVMNTTSTTAINVVGNQLSNYLVGNAGANSLSGGLGNDTLSGGAGNDTLIGGVGNDQYLITETADVIKENAGEGYDTVFVSAASYTLSTNIEDLVFNGTGAFTGVGNDGANQLFANTSTGAKLDGGAGNDTLVGAAGNDNMRGGTGDDRIETNGGNDTVDGGAGNDYVTGLDARDSYTITRTASDTVLTDSDGQVITVRGVETFYFGSQMLTLEQVQADTAGPGNDSLLGTSGNDTLDGAAGADTLTGGAGDDVYRIDNSGDRIVELAGSGIDRVETTLASYTLGANLEHLRYTGTVAFTGIGNELDNTLQGGIGSDKLTGGLGSDTFVFGSKSGIDTVTDFVSGTDHLLLDLKALGLNTDHLGVSVHDTPGGFGTDEQLMLFSARMASASTANAATVIGSASSAYAVGDTALFLVSTAKDTTLYRFVSSAADAKVSAGELTALVVLTGTPSTTLDDYFFTA